MAKHRGALKNGHDGEGESKKKKRLTIIDEFKTFILRGNVIDLAVGIIIGGAFNKIVTSLVNDIVMPLVSVVIGKDSLSARFIALDGQSYASMEAAGEVPLLKYGSFLSTVLDFLLMGFIIFLLVKGINFLYEKVKKDKPAPPEPAAPAAKTCPYCISEIHPDAVICPHCASKQETANA